MVGSTMLGRVPTLLTAPPPGEADLMSAAIDGGGGTDDDEAAGEVVGGGGAGVEAEGICRDSTEAGGRLLTRVAEGGCRGEESTMERVDWPPAAAAATVEFGTTGASTTGTGAGC